MKRGVGRRGPPTLTVDAQFQLNAIVTRLISAAGDSYDYEDGVALRDLVRTFRPRGHFPAGVLRAGRWAVGFHVRRLFYRVADIGIERRPPGDDPFAVGDQYRLVFLRNGEPAALQAYVPQDRVLPLWGRASTFVVHGGSYVPFKKPAAKDK